ncbi:MAG: ATP-dependent protease ATPase subunit HslU [Spirochaetales bacterium]|uniref:ATP-dependent protease ATPase subunit HslU n=1 Tax=Bullifex sp. TaxID=2815808 RepID=UPI002A58347C|nr:ATP-dependent protease ATPase subunit HslU [Bullifex sp.]MDD5972384.1 ATP-dependent protease ATPase subunit HslU [Spirochaetales bacterium]MDD7270652.1 ATP-dependent protease ATPase subunit HslU [Spirochaetales bacterium]MDY4068217.1 ATP-dependent protease ATPase subunit HslU [Bullifex sp.]
MKKLDEMFPREIVKELDRYIIGQDEAKKMIAIAIRNRARRKMLPDVIREEINPKNIMMIGPTGVGKTEIARRIAKLANAPFIKIEATKYTEVGYVGRDVESMVRDLMATSIQMVRDEMAKSKEDEVSERVNNRLVDLLLPTVSAGANQMEESITQTRDKFKELLLNGVFEDKEVEMRVNPSTRVEIGVMGNGNMTDDIQEAMSSLSSLFQKPKTRKVTIKRAREIIKEEEMDKAVDPEKAIDEAKVRCEEMGIIFIDEIDKIAQRGGDGGGRGEVSREGVQRDILPIVEGTKVSTKWGAIDTTNILFIAAGAFSLSKPSDLIPELQGRFPIRVELNDLSADDFYRILTEPSNAITMQYKALIKTEGVDLEFTEGGLRRIAELAHEVNQTNENIGARRLHTIMEKLLEDVSFSADQIVGQTVTITPEYVDERLKDIAQSQDLSRYIL